MASFQMPDAREFSFTFSLFLVCFAVFFHTLAHSSSTFKAVVRLSKRRNSYQAQSEAWRARKSVKKSKADALVVR